MTFITQSIWFRRILLLAAVTILLWLPQPFPHHLTKVDFQAYWGASYLLSKSENFADADKLLEVQRQFTEWTEDSAQMTWNPPWLLAWFLPYTFLKFDKASWVWFLTNIFLLFVSTWYMWRLFPHQDSTRKLLGIGLLVTFLFIPTITLLLVGQISTLILLGLTLFLYFDRKNEDFMAGIGLSLTTIKPHLVYITLPLLLLHLLWHKRWKALLGFALLPAVGTFIAVWLRPTFPGEYMATMGESNLLRLTVPTLGYFLATVVGWRGLRLMGLVILPVVLLLWYFQPRKEELNLVNWTVTTLILSTITAPFGWSFDMVLLLLPVQYGLVAMVEGRVERKTAVIVSFLFVFCNLFMLYQRTLEVWDDKFFWFPIAVAILGGTLYGFRTEKTRLPASRT